MKKGEEPVGGLFPLIFHFQLPFPAKQLQLSSFLLPASALALSLLALLLLALPALLFCFLTALFLHRIVIHGFPLLKSASTA